jgi:hypothetical protein
MAVTFKHAHKAESKLRMALAGPSGAGKTYTSLQIATALAGDAPIAVIDTERGSASMYSDIFSFDVLELDTFHPDHYIEAIKAAQDAGYGVLVIDSLTHAWEGKGGLLEIVEGIAKRSYGGNTFRAWADGTPIQNRLIDAITGARMHIIATMRTKSDYAMDKDERTGKTAPRKIGLAVKQRDGIEYEFDIFSKMTLDNEMIVEKSRCPELAGQIIRRPGADVAEVLARWLQGESASAVNAPVQPSSVAADVDDWQADRDAGVKRGLIALRYLHASDQRTYITSLRRQFDEEGWTWDQPTVMNYLRQQYKQQAQAEKEARSADASADEDVGEAHSLEGLPEGAGVH